MREPEVGQADPRSGAQDAGPRASLPGAGEPDPSDPQSLGGGRYRVLGRLGRGGMARVFRVEDGTRGRVLALKRLTPPADAAERKLVTTLFEREYHTLVQLAHPHVVEVYDFGTDGGAPYYTMELLDGGDLRERSPLPWRTACELLFDVASSLALVHSRRLVHRDISPRNVRCTLSGRAKLIDFGGLAPFGPNSQVVGTPAFIAPEALHGSTLDARTDLYSLGASLYFALTGHTAYAARDLASVLRAWSSRPAPPSAFIADVPAELDALVMALLSLDPTLRPPSAFEVMQRLAAVAGLDRQEPLSVSQAYLVTPSLVGRDEALSAFRRQLMRALSGRGGSLLFEAAAGLGRSRLLDVCVLEAKTAGALAMRAGALEAGYERFAVARTLAQHMLDAIPELALATAKSEGVAETLFDFAKPGADAAPAEPSLRTNKLTPPEELSYQTALARWFLAVGQRHPLLVAVDDVEQVDPASLAFLAALAHRAGRRRLLLCLTSITAPESGLPGLDVLRSHSTPFALRPLQPLETEALLASLFGDAANMPGLSARIHSIAAGFPRETMALAQHLVDRGAISYAAGIWTLPETLAPSDLPSSAEDLFRQRVAALGPDARHLAEAQALAVFGSFSRDDYAKLAPSASPEALSHAIDELVAREIAIGDGQRYSLSHEAVKRALIAGLGEAQRRAHHVALAELLIASDRSGLAIAHHLLLGGKAQAAIDRMVEILGVNADRDSLATWAQMNVSDIAELIERALLAAPSVRCSPRALYELRRWLLMLSVAADSRYYAMAAAPLLTQLERDSGLAFFREQDPALDPMQRLTRALTRASELYAATPEAERVFRVDEAIKYLVHYVVVSIAIGASSLDVRLIESLPALLEPFAPLSAVLHAMWQNALATRESTCYGRFERARKIWSELYERLGQVSGQDLQYVEAVRNAVAFGVGALEAQLGLESAGAWAAVLDRDPQQRVAAMNLRKAVCMQHGDFTGADAFRRKAEVLALQATAPQMFANMLSVELWVHAAARDLTGVKRVRDRIAPLAAKHPGWRAYQLMAEAQFQRLRGDLERACAALEQAVELCEPDASDPTRLVPAWSRVASIYVETLVERGQYHEAREFGERALKSCEALGIVVARFDVERALALAEGKLGERGAAAARLERVIAAQRELGVSGLNLGLNLEARACVAIWAGDREAVEQYAPLAAREYRHGRGSSLGTRYERLMQEARASGIRTLPPASELEHSVLGPAMLGGERPTIESTVTEALSVADNTEALVRRALGLLCAASKAQAGRLYVMRDQGLVLAATHGAEAAEDELGLVQEFWDRQLQDPDLPTAFLAQMPQPSVTTDTQWTQASGAARRPLLLHCTMERKLRHVGVAVLVSDASAQPGSSPMEVATTVAAHLVRAGAATGVAA